MLRSDFSYDLPEALIAQSPLPERGASRLLCLDGGTGALEDRRFGDIVDLLRPGDLLVLNDTFVVPARLHAVKDTGGRVEILLERIVGGSRALVQLKASKATKPGARIDMPDGSSATVLAREQSFYILEFERDPARLFERWGRVPLPPYIRRPDAAEDRDRYQTVYAKAPGAVAAPTAGLHFDEDLLARLAARGVARAFVTLHVGAGTFQPVRETDVRRHVMHRERVEVDESACRAVRQTKESGGRIVAVGTTAVRCLEAAAESGELRPFAGDTGLFIYPGYRFHIVDAMITNFHLPESTLLMLVCAFAGEDRVLAAYRHAVEQRYRFFSYGDAMWVTRRSGD